MAESRAKSLMANGICILAVLLMVGLDSIMELILHGPSPSFDLEHLVVGGVSGAVTAALCIVLRLQARERQRRLELANQDLHQRLDGGAEELRAANLRAESELQERVFAERAVAESEEMFRSLVESTDDSIYVVDRNHRYLFANAKHASRLGHTQGLAGWSYESLHSTEETRTFTALVDTVLTKGESLQHEQTSRRDGRTFLRSLSPVKGPDGMPFAVTVLSKDVSHLKRMEESFRDLSLKDELTGLYNRRGLLTLAEQEMKVARRLQRGISIFFADLDDLKKINDSRGHAEGDKAIQTAARILRECSRESDIVARLGGDEFVVLQMESGEGAAELLAERFEERLRRYNRENPSEPLSLSVGWACCGPGAGCWAACDPENACKVEVLLARADQSMYEKKKARRC